MNVVCGTLVCEDGGECRPKLSLKLDRCNLCEVGSEGII